MTLETQRTRTVLDGVPEYDAASESFSDVLALSAALRAQGEAADFDTLSALSGEAFRSVAHADRWEIASAYVSQEGVLAAGARAFGYRPRYVIGASADETWMAITDAVDAGQPALSSGILAAGGKPASTWWFVVRGYDSQERTVQLAGRLTGTNDFAPLPRLHGRPGTWVGVVKGLNLAPALWAERPVFVLGLKGRPPEPQALALESIRRAVETARDATVTVQTEVSEACGRYVLGLSAFQVWADQLAAITGREAFFRRGPLEGPTPSVDVTAANNERAHRTRLGRRAAAKHLRSVSDLFVGPAHDALLSAAAGYSEVAELAEEYLRLFAGHSPLADQNLLLDHDHRREGVFLIRQMLALEGAAVAQLETALKHAGAAP